MTDTERLPQHELKVARRRLCRKLGQMCVAMMAGRDLSFRDVAIRMGQKEKTVRRWIMKLIDGKEGRGLRFLGEFAFACGYEIDFTVKPREEPHD